MNFAACSVFQSHALLSAYQYPLKIVQRLDVSKAFAGDGAEGEGAEEVHEKNLRDIKPLPFLEGFQRSLVAPVVDRGSDVSRFFAVCPEFLRKNDTYQPWLFPSGRARILSITLAEVILDLPPAFASVTICRGGQLRRQLPGESVPDGRL